MFKRLGWIASAMLAMFLMGAPSQIDAASGKDPKIEGVLAGKAANGVTIRTQAGKLVSVGADATTKVELNGVRVTLAKLPIGAVTQATLPAGATVASKIESKK